MEGFRRTSAILIYGFLIVLVLLFTSGLASYPRTVTDDHFSLYLTEEGVLSINFTEALEKLVAQGYEARSVNTTTFNRQLRIDIENSTSLVVFLTERRDSRLFIHGWVTYDMHFLDDGFKRNREARKEFVKTELSGVLEGLELNVDPEKVEWLSGGGFHGGEFVFYVFVLDSTLVGIAFSGFLHSYKRGQMVKRAIEDWLLSLGLTFAYLGTVGVTFFLIMGLWLGGWDLCVVFLGLSVGGIVVGAALIWRWATVQRGLW